MCWCLLTRSGSPLQLELGRPCQEEVHKQEVETVVVVEWGVREVEGW